MWIDYRYLQLTRLNKSVCMKQSWNIRMKLHSVYFKQRSVMDIEDRNAWSKVPRLSVCSEDWSMRLLVDYLSCPWCYRSVSVSSHGEHHGVLKSHVHSTAVQIIRFQCVTMHICQHTPAPGQIQVSSFWAIIHICVQVSVKRPKCTSYVHSPDTPPLPTSFQALLFFLTSLYPCNNYERSYVPG